MSQIAIRRGLLSPLLLFLLLSLFLVPATAQAQAGIGMSGTFSQQTFEIPQGEQISSPGIYVVILNPQTETLDIQMSSEAPFGVEVLFSESKFFLSPGGEKKVYITVKVSQDAPPGEYQLTVTAEAFPIEEGAVRVGVASAQTARLMVTGESASISARAVSPDGDPIRAQIRLSKVIEGRLNELAVSDTGTVEAKVSPGRFTAVAFVGGAKLAEETVDIQAGESKQVSLVVRTVYFEFFGTEPNYEENSERLVFVRMAYTINNLYEALNNVEVFLQVKRDGQPLEEVNLISFGRLDTGRTGGQHRYVPDAGWKKGDYSFNLELHIQGKPYIDSAQEIVQVAELAQGPGPLSNLWRSVASKWWLIAIIALTIALSQLAARLRTLLRDRRIPKKQEATPRQKEAVRPVKRGYTLTVSVNPPDGGLVTVAPSPRPDGSYEPGQPAFLASLPNPGYIFIGWSGDLASARIIASITLDSDKLVTANFSPR